RRLAQAGHFGEPRWGCRDHFCKRTKFFEQLLGQRLDVTARQRAKENELEQFIVGDRLSARLAKSRPQPLAVAVIVRDRRGRGGLFLVAAVRHDCPRLPDWQHPAARLNMTGIYLCWQLLIRCRHGARTAFSAIASASTTEGDG